MISNFTHVQKALQRNREITIVGAPNCKYRNESCWTHSVEFYTAPVNGLYTAGELQLLMISLVPKLKPTEKYNFHENSYAMEFGLFYFDNEVKKLFRRRVVSSTRNTSFSGGFVESTEKIHERILVRLYPNVEIATGALAGAWESQIPKSELRKYRKTALS